MVQTTVIPMVARVDLKAEEVEQEAPGQEVKDMTKEIEEVVVMLDVMITLFIPN